MWGKNQGIPNSSAGDLPTVSEFLLLGWSKNAKWKCFRVAEQLQLRERTCTTRNARNVNLSVDLSLISNPSIQSIPLAYVLACHVHTFYSSLTFRVIVLHVTLRLIADLSSPFLSLFADWSCLSFLQNVV